MNEQMGQTVEDVIRKKQINLSQLASNLSVNRSMLYSWFKTKRLRPDIILRVGQAIEHDFSKQFPDLASLNMISEPFKKKLELTGSFKDKYIDLLERYSQLLEIRNGSTDNMISINSRL